MDWTHDHDLLLAESVLKATREGVKIEVVWSEVAQKLGCKVADCENRWEEELKFQYRIAYQLAQKCYLMTTMIKPPEKEKMPESKEKKAEGKAKTAKHAKRKTRTKKKSNPTEDIDLDRIIVYLRKLKKLSLQPSEVDLLKQENQALQEKFNQLNADYESLRADFAEVISILKRAKEMSDVG